MSGEEAALCVLLPLKHPRTASSTRSLSPVFAVQMSTPDCSAGLNFCIAI